MGTLEEEENQRSAFFNEDEANSDESPEKTATNIIRPKRPRKILKEIFTILFFFIVVFAFRSSLFEPYRIPSGSMIPTLYIGDFILVNKFSYGLKVPFSDVSVGKVNLNPIYLWGKSSPERGDVVVFKYPKNPGVNYIKRVIGLPGDEIFIKNKMIFVNGVKIETKAINGDEIMADIDEQYKGYNLKLFESQTGKRKHLIQIDKDNYFKTDYGKRTVPKGKFFVMGDNRDFSHDSRFWGFVPANYIRGKALFVWFNIKLPKGRGGEGLVMRPWRIGTLIQ
jgi:signal peptidase I